MMKPERKDESVRPFSLRHTAAAVARNYGDKGAVVITLGSEGVRIGTENLTPQELREALCTAIHYSYVFEKSDLADPEELTS
jgi:hypothetical protein